MSLRKGSDFSIPIPTKYMSLMRCRNLRNPEYAAKQSGAFLHTSMPWIRMALFFDTPEDVTTAKPFNSIDPIASLAASLDVPSTETIDTLALVLSEKLNSLNVEMTAKDVRRKCHKVNEIHCGSMEIELAAPDITKYQGYPFLESILKSGDVVKVAVIEKDRIFRAGTARFENFKGATKIHPLARLLMEATHPRKSDIRFDRIETGPWGVRCGILGWNTRAMNLGALLGEIFVITPELFDEASTGIFTDQYGRVCTYYGWILSSGEVIAPDVACRLMELIGSGGYQKAHILRANKDVLQFFDETKMQYTEKWKNVLAGLFWGYMYLTPEAWSSAVERLQTQNHNLALEQVYNLAAQVHLEAEANLVFRVLNLLKGK